MPQITQTQLVSAALAHGGAAPMTTAEIVGEEIARFLASPRRREMERARAYYANRSAVQDKPDNLPGRSNARIEHPIYRKLVDRNAAEFLCIDCLAAWFQCPRAEIEKRIRWYRESGQCTLFR